MMNLIGSLNLNNQIILYSYRDLNINLLFTFCLKAYIQFYTCKGVHLLHEVHEQLLIVAQMLTV